MQAINFPEFLHMTCSNLLNQDKDTTTEQQSSDQSLIDTARGLNASCNGHLKRSIEDFWRLGETLSHLFQRRHLKGRWADILAQIGINVTTDSHARRLFQATTLDGLAEFKNKTAALRALGILSTPTVKERKETPQGASPDESQKHLPPNFKEQIAVNPENGADKNPLSKSDRPENRIAPMKQRRVVEAVQLPAERDADQTPPIASQANAEGTGDSLEVLAKIAARLEYLGGDEIDVTADHLIQIDRAMKALARLQARSLSGKTS